MLALRRTLTTLATLLAALGTMIAFGPVAFAQRPPLPDDSYPAPTTSTESTASTAPHLWMLVAIAVAVAALTLAAVLTTARLRHARRGSTALA